jgi:hypothetical protein
LFSLDTTPVKLVRIFLSVACVCFAIASGGAFLASEHITPASEAYRSIAGLVFLFALLIAFGAIIAATISGISMVVRHREDLGFHDYSLIVGASILGVLVLLVATDVATGNGFALYAWQVPVTVRVVDASTGTPIENARVSYAFSFAEQPDYKPVGAVATGPSTRFEIRMIYCRAEGGIFSRLKGPPRPVPSMYRFELAAAGFLPQRVDGESGELVENPHEPSSERFVLQLPEVKLEPLPK